MSSFKDALRRIERQDFDARMGQYREMFPDVDVDEGLNPLRMAMLILMLVAPRPEAALAVAVRAMNLTLVDGRDWCPSGTKFAVALGAGLQNGPLFLTEVKVNCGGGFAAMRWRAAGVTHVTDFVDEIHPAAARAEHVKMSPYVFTMDERLISAIWRDGFAPENKQALA